MLILGSNKDQRKKFASRSLAPTMLVGKYVDENGSATMLPAKMSTGVKNLPPRLISLSVNEP